MCRVVDSLAMQVLLSISSGKVSDLAPNSSPTCRRRRREKMAEAFSFHAVLEKKGELSRCGVNDILFSLSLFFLYLLAVIQTGDRNDVVLFTCLISRSLTRVKVCLYLTR